MPVAEPTVPIYSNADDETKAPEGWAPAGEPAVAWQLGHRTSLDALRGIAVLCVLFGHFDLPGFAAGGGVGVALFFALSGYLITGILLRGSDLPGFYVRRARRLLPALAVLVVGIGAWSAVAGRLGAFSADALPVLLYIANWSWIAGQPLIGLAHTWSLAVEEQFYLVWPVALWLLLRRGLGFAIAATVAIIVASFVLTLAQPEYLRAFAGSDTRAKDILVGCLVALVSRARGADLRIPTAAAIVAVVPLVLVGSFLVPGEAANWITPIPCAVLVAWFAARPSFMDWRPLTFTGRISYGLYLYHYPFAYGAWPVFEGISLWPRMAALFVTSYTLATASWFAVERRFLTARSTPSPA
jgi:peptidoglycan/LPS O-acetylase OafA/YrhL